MKAASLADPKFHNASTPTPGILTRNEIERHCLPAIQVSGLEKEEERDIYKYRHRHAHNVAGRKHTAKRYRKGISHSRNILSLNPIPGRSLITLLLCGRKGLYPGKRLRAVEPPRLGSVEVVEQKQVKGPDLGHGGQLGLDPGVVLADELHGPFVDDLV